MEQLLILGNGFDLTLGLKSKYLDFYENDFKKRNECNKISFWEYLLNNEDRNWSDVEQFIEDYLKAISIDYLNLSLENLKEEQFIRMNRKFLSQERINWTNINNIFFKKYNPEISYLDFLFYELKNLEKYFRQYLITHKKRAFMKYTDHYGTYYDNYINRSNSLINQLCNVNNQTSILNFNYTTIQIDEINKNNIFNIHGTLENENNIIGTDLDIINHSNSLMQFTKPFRIVNDYKRNDNFKQLISDQLNEIIFYGHSLGHTDFSYFKSIFDSIDLYSGKTILTFYICIYDSNNKNNIIGNFTSNILVLLNKYSKLSNKIDNKDVSLFTKLLLEGRLNIKLLEVDEYLKEQEASRQKRIEKRKKKKENEQIFSDIHIRSLLSQKDDILEAQQYLTNKMNEFMEQSNIKKIKQQLEKNEKQLHNIENHLSELINDSDKKELK